MSHDHWHGGFPLPRAYRTARNSRWFWPYSEKTCRLSLAPRKPPRPPVAEGARTTLHSFGNFLRTGPPVVEGHTSRGEPSRNFRNRAGPTDISGGNGLGQNAKSSI